ALHDLTNVLASARAYGHLLHVRASTGSQKDPVPVLEALLEDLDRIGGIGRDLRMEIFDQYLRAAPPTRRP
ncbi:MAG TPA: hypothetical protein VNZ52_01840, partial [Candidatus Thermoplasmatota archaeon]|nr:hypothetical protein [Candidatus Thermoplasmatota archaeon]